MECRQVVRADQSNISNTHANPQSSNPQIRNTLLYSVLLWQHVTKPLPACYQLLPDVTKMLRQMLRSDATNRLTVIGAAVPNDYIVLPIVYRATVRFLICTCYTRIGTGVSTATATHTPIPIMIPIPILVLAPTPEVAHTSTSTGTDTSTTTSTCTRTRASMY